MAEIVNLRRVKKRLSREAEAAQAEANRTLHGRSRAEREAADRVRHQADRALDGARLDRDREPPE